MPTSAASGASLPRICSASWPTRASGSGSEVGMGIGVVQVALQDERGGERVDVTFTRRARALAAQARLGLGGGERLVDEDHGQLVARGEAPAEFLGQLRGRVLRVVRVL